MLFIDFQLEGKQDFTGYIAYIVNTSITGVTAMKTLRKIRNIVIGKRYGRLVIIKETKSKAMELLLKSLKWFYASVTVVMKQ